MSNGSLEMVMGSAAINDIILMWDTSLEAMSHTSAGVIPCELQRLTSCYAGVDSSSKVRNTWKCTNRKALQNPLQESAPLET